MNLARLGKKSTGNVWVTIIDFSSLLEFFKLWFITEAKL